MRSHVDDYGEVKLDDHGNIRPDLPCMNCGYNLRGLSYEGKCPECGEAKAISFWPYKHTLRWWLIPAAPLTGINIAIAAFNEVCYRQVELPYWMGPSLGTVWDHTCSVLSNYLPMCLFLMFAISFVLLLTKRQDLPILLTLLISILLLLLQQGVA